MIDTTPTSYRRPDDSRIREAMRAVFNIVECIDREACIQGEGLLRFVMAKGATLAQAMWAIHELAEMGGFETTGWHGRNLQKPSVIGLRPPAGVDVVSGELHLSGGPNWEQIGFMPKHDKLDAIRQEMITDSPTLPDKRDGVGDKQKNKPPYRRLMSREAADCARRYKKAKKIDSGTRMRHVVQEYVDKHGGSAKTIMRILNDNPDQWKV